MRRLVITVSYRADVLRRFPSRCQVLAGGFLSATLATCDRSLPFRSPESAPRSTGRSEEPPAALLGTGGHARIRCHIDEAEYLGAGRPSRPEIPREDAPYPLPAGVFPDEFHEDLQLVPAVRVRTVKV